MDKMNCHYCGRELTFERNQSNTLYPMIHPDHGSVLACKDCVYEVQSYEFDLKMNVESKANK